MNKYRELFIKTIDNLEDLLCEINKPIPGNIPTVYRGQANSEWPILSSFYRWYKRKYSKAIHSHEIFSLEEINKNLKNKIDDHYFNSANKIIQIFSNNIGKIEGLDLSYANLNYLGQHYSIPTNLIDFTIDPYIALFFAFNFERKPDSGYVSLYKTTPTVFAQAAIQNIVRHHFINQEEIFKEITSLNQYDKTIKLPSVNLADYQINKRIQAQKGCFVYFPYNFSYEKIMYEMECWQPTGGWGSQKNLIFVFL